MIKRLTALVVFLIFFQIPGDKAPCQDRQPSGPPRPLVVAVYNDPPFTMKNEQGQWTGLNMDLWFHLAGTMKRPYVVKEMTFDELMAALRNGTVDLSLAALYLTAERERSFDMTVPLFSTRPAVATLYAEDAHPWWEAVKLLFSWGTFKIITSLLIILVILGFLFWLIERRHNPEHFGEGTIKGIGAGIYWVGSTLASGVCFGVSLKSPVGRILGLLWMLTCALALSAFIASLTTSLTARQAATKALGMQALRKMHIGSVSDSMTGRLAAMAGGKYTPFKKEEDAMTALLNRRIDGFLYGEGTLRYYEERDFKRKISVFPTTFRRHPIALAMPKGSPLRKEINIAILQVMDEPVWDQLLSRYGFAEMEDAKTVVLGKKPRGGPILPGE